MTINTTLPASKTSDTLRDWHKDRDIQAFINALSQGLITNERGMYEPMSRDTIEVMLSHIDTKYKFVSMVKEYLPEHLLEEGYDIYTIDRETLYTENSELFLAYAKPDWAKSNEDLVNFIYESISYYGIGDITHEDVYQAFLKGNRVTINQQDAWHTGYQAIIGQALHCLFLAYAKFTGLIKTDSLK